VELERLRQVGLSPYARQIRRTVVCDIPVVRAVSMVDQCVAFFGVSSSVVTTTRSTSSSVIVLGAPGLGSSTVQHDPQPGAVGPADHRPPPCQLVAVQGAAKLRLNPLPAEGDADDLGTAAGQIGEGLLAVVVVVAVVDSGIGVREATRGVYGRRPNSPPETFTARRTGPWDRWCSMILAWVFGLSTPSPPLALYTASL
jgi:hypothetical protein